MCIRLASSVPSDAERSRPALSAALITDPADLAPLDDAWQRLASAVPHAGVFAAPGFHRALGDAFRLPGRLAAVVVRHEGQVCGMLPLRRRWVQRRGVPFRELGLPRHPHVQANCLLLGDTPRAALEAALTLLRQQGGWDVLLLEHVVPPPGGLGFVQDAADAAGLAMEPWHTTRVMGYLPLQRTFDAYLATRPQKFRSQLRGYERDAAALGPVSYERLDSPAALRAALPAMFELERRSRSGRAAATAMGAAEHRFHLRLTETLPPTQTGELWLMRIAERPAAALRLLRHRDTLHAHVMYFDAEYAAVSPGKLLMREALRSAWERGLEEMDFHGDSLFISRWSGERRRYCSTRLYAPTPYGRLLYHARRLERHLRGGTEAHA